MREFCTSGSARGEGGNILTYSATLASPASWSYSGPIVTGLEAIGRGHDQRSLQAFVKEIIATLTPEVAIRYINLLELINRAAASYDIDPNNLVRTEDEVKANEQQAQMAALAQHLGPEALKQAGGMAQQQMAPPEGA
jgi:hypothetical protein